MIWNVPAASLPMAPASFAAWVAEILILFVPPSLGVMVSLVVAKASSVCSASKCLEMARENWTGG